ncbi:MAG: ATPase [Candidatus Parabeggiatoa sp. nov. 2]|nr:MAG: ATPase [Gammaproteobacteria bacterium]
MWVEELTLENIRCFKKATLKFSEKGQPYRWITFLGENGGGKTTALQALGLLLAGPEGARQLTRPLGWLRDELKAGQIATRIHQGEHDPGLFGGENNVEHAFNYSYFITGSQPMTIRNETFTEPTLVENKDSHLTWLRQNALTSTGQGWFAVGYGAFRRLTRTHQIILPSLGQPARLNNFTTQFDEDQPLAAFEQWMLYLDYRILKSNDKQAKRQQELGVAAINQVLPKGVTFDSVTAEGRILFNLGGRKVPTIALSDGYRSMLALTGDLVWRLLLAFPDSEAPLEEEGVVLIDELDIHLHPIWQHEIAVRLQTQFPKLQFFVTTHSPLIAAGAGIEALTYRFVFHDGKTVVEKIEDIASLNVDRVLQSKAFGLGSRFSQQTQATIDRYDALMRKKQRTEAEDQALKEEIIPIIQKAFPFGYEHAPDSLEAKIKNFLSKTLK